MKSEETSDMGGNNVLWTSGHLRKRQCCLYPGFLHNTSQRQKKDQSEGYAGGSAKRAQTKKVRERTSSWGETVGPRKKKTKYETPQWGGGENTKFRVRRGQKGTPRRNTGF